ncbi:hypothetical protein AWB69_08571 [Caballeronia udeis]|uniref:Uncharacterized protein n=2 Tax=Caballeronia udeis TaxID=1232866 RepID=A0A158JQL6_9BURK|nr:hypothetical protein AWB69_08571 [Caballeronia udeis]
MVPQSLLKKKIVARPTTRRLATPSRRHATSPLVNYLIRFVSLAGYTPPLFYPRRIITGVPVLNFSVSLSPSAPFRVLTKAARKFARGLVVCFIRFEWLRTCLLESLDAFSHEIS